MSIGDINWEELAEKLPYERTPEAYAKRSELFDLFDPNGNGYLSLAEVDKGIRDILQLDDIFNAKPAIMRAFQASKNYVPDNGYGPDYVQRKEFRILLQYLRHYFELWVMFETIDQEEDRRVDLEEFTAALPKLSAWGILIEEGEAEQVFSTIDSNDGGQVLFAEFCTWAIKQKLDLGEEANDGEVKELTMTSEEKIRADFEKYDLNGDGTIQREELAAVFAELNPEIGDAELDQILAVADLDKDGNVDYKEFVNWLFNKHAGREGATTKAVRKKIATSGVDWEKINEKLPYERTPEAYQKRSELFSRFDPNGNGYLSLAEVDKGLRDVLELDEIFDAKPAIMRAFQAAKNAVPDNGYGPDYVQRKEFRILLQYLKHYFELWVMFEEIDSAEDRRVNLEEFTAAVPKLTEWGCEIEDPEATFGEIDTNGGGQVLFAEFCSWAISKKLDLGEEGDEIAE